MLDISAPSILALGRGGGSSSQLSKVERRYDAVVAFLRDELSVTEAAEKFGVSRQTLYRWMSRYEAEGLDGLLERSHRPRHVPHQMSAVLEARVLELRRQGPHWGPINLQHQLRRDGVDGVPSHMAIYPALVRHGLIEERRARKRLRTYKRVRPQMNCKIDHDLTSWGEPWKSNPQFRPDAGPLASPGRRAA